MFSPFRKIRKELTDENRILKYIWYAIGEIVLVVVGILIALQVNNWNEDRNTRRIEQKLLNELKKDLEETKVDLLSDIKKAHNELRVTDSIYQKILHDRTERNPEPIKITMHFIYNRSDLFPKKSAYESLQAFGINLVSNDSLRKSITDLYELQLVRVDALEKFIKESSEENLAPYLFRVSKPSQGCVDCNSLAELFPPESDENLNYFEVKEPSDELVHLLKTKYLAYSALTGLYADTERRINALIESIDSGTEP